MFSLDTRKQNYDKDAMLIAVRRSLRGEAGMVAMRIDLDANIDDIIRKLDSIYGSVDRKEILLTQFYGARQEKNEVISHWSCRLERIIGKCVDGGLVHHSEVRISVFYFTVALLLFCFALLLLINLVNKLFSLLH